MDFLKDNTDAAVALGKRGFRVLLCTEVLPDGECSCPPNSATRSYQLDSPAENLCKKPGKHPQGDDWYKTATGDEAAIRQRWAPHPGRNIGIATGLDDLVVIDIDAGEGKSGMQTWQTLQKKHGPVPETLIARTGGGGLHYYFRTSLPLGNGTNVFGDQTHIDLRGVGGMVLAPPSITFKGQYEWVSAPDAPIAVMPAWMEQMLSGTNSRATTAKPTKRTTRQKPQMTEDEIREMLAIIPSDDRDVWMKVGVALKHEWLAVRELPESEAYAIWDAWAQHAPNYEPNENERQWRSYKVDREPGERRGQITLASLVSLAKKYGWVPSATVADDEVNEAVEELNEYHFVATEGGQTRVYTIEYDPQQKREKLETSSFEDFRNYYLNRKLTIGYDRSGNPIRKAKGHVWLEHSARRQYRKIVFIPTEDGAPEDCYNLWKGFAVKPAAGDWSLLKDHILTNVCQGSQEAYIYVIRWMAFKVQNPACRPEVAIVLRGRKGTGKGTLAQAFGSLFSQHYVYVNTGNHLTGKFNAHLRDALFVFADEAYWAGDKQAESTLKALITEPVLVIEGKFKARIQCPNMIALVMASNAEWAVPTSLDERRFCVLDVGEERIQNTDYFNAIQAQMEQGGKAAMLHELLTIDLSDFNHRKAPKTTALQYQQLQSFSPMESWWYQRLQDGYLVDEDADWEEPVPTKELFHGYVESVGKGGVYYKGDQIKFGLFLEKMLRKVTAPTNECAAGNEAWPVRQKITIYEDDFSGERKERVKRKRWHYLFPNLRECRDAFEAQAPGFKANWDRSMERAPDYQMRLALPKEEEPVPF
jgi:hypothetical protein